MRTDWQHCILNAYAWDQTALRTKYNSIFRNVLLKRLDVIGMDLSSFVISLHQTEKYWIYKAYCYQIVTYTVVKKNHCRSDRIMDILNCETHLRTNSIRAGMGGNYTLQRSDHFCNQTESERHMAKLKTHLRSDYDILKVIETSN